MNVLGFGTSANDPFPHMFDEYERRSRSGSPPAHAKVGEDDEAASVQRAAIPPLKEINVQDFLADGTRSFGYLLIITYTC